MVATKYIHALATLVAFGTAANGQTYPNVSSNGQTPSNAQLAYSPHFYPSPQGGRTTDGAWKEAYQKARQFVSQLSLAEKVNLTSGIAGNGVCVGSTADLPEREDMWGLCLMDGPLNIRTTDLNTGYPAGIAAGATFNRDLIHARGKAIGSEFRGKGVDIMLGPVVGPLGLRAQNGRGFEAFGSDPYLQGIASAETVEGIQSNGVIANAKHFIAYEQETHRLNVSSNLGDRALHEMYAWPFADMIHSGVGSVMCSYNLINNSFACENSYTLNKVLKDELGFQGFVVSDWYGTHSGVNAITSGLDMNMPGEGFFAANLSISVLNQTVPLERVDDMATRIMAAFYKVEVDKARKERGPPNFSARTTDDTDRLYPGSDYGPIVTVNRHVDVRTPQNYHIARDVASESVILLKNKNNTLPFKGSKMPKRITALGAASRLNSYGPNCREDGCDESEIDGATQLGWGSGATNYPYFITPYDGLVERTSKDWITVNANANTNSSTDEFKLAATSSDVNVIYVLASSGEGQDRSNTSLWLNGAETIKAAAAIHPNNVVVINSVGQVDMSDWIDHENITAVVFGLPLGQDTGRVFADVLFGDVNPSGRLPFTIARNASSYYAPVDTPPASNGFYQDNEVGQADLLIDYRYFDVKNVDPLFEFGFGLSYSNFTLSCLQINEVQKPSQNLPPPPALQPVYQNNDQIPSAEELLFPQGMDRVPNFQYPYINSTSQAEPHGTYPFPDGYSTVQKSSASLAGGASGGNPALWNTAYRVSATVKNNGPVAGKYVAELYIGYPESEEYPTAPRQLRGFAKPYLQPGQCTKVDFDIRTRDLTVWDVKTASWIVLPGEYTIYVGSSSRKLELQGTITI